MEDDAKALLTKIGYETSLRYAIQLISAAGIVCEKRKGMEVTVEDIGKRCTHLLCSIPCALAKVYGLFCDVKRSVQYLVEFQEQYMFNEAEMEEVEDRMET